MQKVNVAIIGGGAAGLAAAIRLKQLKNDVSVAVVEQLPRVGKKLITTGNGRCNITNKNIEISRYHSENPDFCSLALEKYNLDFTAEFFENLGIVFTFDEQGRGYPYSLQASSVVDALRFGAENAGVQIFAETKVQGIEVVKNGFALKTDKEGISADVLLLAAGLLSGGKKIGSDGSVIRILKDMGYKTVRMTPAIVQIKTEPQTVRQLKGIKVNANASVLSGGKTLRRDYGEVLFCDYGLSGPPVLQLSRVVERIGGKCEIALDLMPEYSFEQLNSMLLARAKALNYRTNDEFLTGLLNKRLGQVILKNCGLSLADSVAKTTRAQIKQITATIKDFRFKATGTTGFENSQVTAGGLDTGMFNSQTLMSKKHSGLFAAGEILDVDGDCGGFNLQWAWSSAFCAAESIIKFLG